MTVVDINDFKQEKQCTHKGERYSVRDNGAVLRHKPEGKRARPNDNKWTLGKENSSNAYLLISNIRIHRIVATAFHGEPPDPNYVVDNIDTNCRNNRPENLRWLTRLENTLKNPVTRKKIEYLCGSIEAFLENPSILNDIQVSTNFKWMRTVTTEEAENCKARMSLWANTDSKPSKSTSAINHKSSFSKRVYKPLQKWEAGLDGEPGLDFSLTPWCAQYMWGTDVYFPCCPSDFGTDRLEDYFNNLKIDALLSYRDDDDIRFKLTVFKTMILEKKSSILVVSKSAENKWVIVGIQLGARSSHFIHFILGSYSSKDEADKAFCDKKTLDDFWSDGYYGSELLL